MRVFVPSAIIAGVALAMWLAVPAKPTETNGERWKRMCAVEAPRAIEDCVAKYALGAAFDKSTTDFKARLHDASR